MNHTKVGDHISAIDTPALVLQLDSFERNLNWMANFCKQQAITLWSHSKTHKSPIIAGMQIEKGAGGVCCQKVSEAEVMVAGGIKNVLISNQVVGQQKCNRIAALNRQAHVSVCVDHPLQVSQLEAAAKQQGVQIEVLVEINVGADRCGISPGEPAVVLAKQIAASSALQFGGLQAYQGKAQHIRNHGEKKDAIAAATKWVEATKSALQQAGIPCPRVCGAGTGSFAMETATKHWTELQCGSYIFMDADYGQNIDETGGFFSTFEHSLFVLTTVISAPDDKDFIVVDGGSKTFSVDRGMPVVWGQPDWTCIRLSDEHGKVSIPNGGHRPHVGDQLWFIPGHCDPTVNLHDWYVGVRHSKVECLWPVSARGALS